MSPDGRDDGSRSAVRATAALIHSRDTASTSTASGPPAISYGEDAETPSTQPRPGGGSAPQPGKRQQHEQHQCHDRPPALRADASPAQGPSRKPQCPHAASLAAAHAKSMTCRAAVSLLSSVLRPQVPPEVRHRERDAASLARVHEPFLEQPVAGGGQRLWRAAEGFGDR